MAVIPVYFGKSRSLPDLRLCGRIISREYWISKDTHQHKKTGIQALLTVGSGLHRDPSHEMGRSRYPADMDHFIAIPSMAAHFGIGAIPAGFRCAATRRNGD
jgi:hypothetical protein